VKLTQKQRQILQLFNNKSDRFSLAIKKKPKIKFMFNMLYIPVHPATKEKAYVDKKKDN